ncbi:MAG TPA: hypothetical protein VF571_07375 [Pyrinomonadaceae bacterium]|jgi:anti-sigma factor RsiW
MQNNNHKSDLNCAFGETLVAVLYNEATEAETENFERHLSRCRECSEELAAFGMLRNAVSDWRENEFVPLSLPNIVLPDETQKIEPAVTGKHSLLQSLRAFFTPANFGWQMAAAGFAGFIILGLFFIGSTDLFKPDNEIARAPSPSVNATPEIAVVPEVVPARNQPTVTQNNSSANASNQPEEKSRKVAARINDKIPKHSGIPAARNDNLPKRRIPAPKTERKVEDLSILPVAEADDNSPRLTNLLEEIEPSE